MKTHTDSGWHFAARPYENAPPDYAYVAWAKRTPIRAGGPMGEPFDETVYFEFGQTEAEALAVLKDEVFSLIPK